MAGDGTEARGDMRPVRLRVCLVSGIFPPDIGGPATFVPKLASSLQERGHEVNVVTLGDRPERGPAFPFAVTRIRRRLAKWRRVPATVRAIASAASYADVIYANGLYLEAVVAARLTRRPLVMKVVGDWAWERVSVQGSVRDTLDVFQRRRYGFAVELLKSLRGWVARRADRVVVPSRYLRTIVSGWGVPPDRIAVVYNALEPVETSTPGDEAISSGRTIVSVARLVPWKGLDSLCRVVARLPGVRLRVVGDGPERPSLESLAARLGIKHRVEFLGRVGPEQVAMILRGGDLFVLNSTYEGLPHVVIEAMQARVPVVATAAGGTPEIVEDRITGMLVRPGDEAHLQRAIEAVLESEELRRRLVAAASERIRVQFQWDKLVAETELILRELSRDEQTRATPAVRPSLPSDLRAPDAPEGEGAARERTDRRAAGCGEARAFRPGKD